MPCQSTRLTGLLIGLYSVNAGVVAETPACVVTAVPDGLAPVQTLPARTASWNCACSRPRSRQLRRWCRAACRSCQPPTFARRVVEIRVFIHLPRGAVKNRPVAKGETLPLSTWPRDSIEIQERLVANRGIGRVKGVAKSSHQQIRPVWHGGLHDDFQACRDPPEKVAANPKRIAAIVRVGIADVDFLLPERVVRRGYLSVTLDRFWIVDRRLRVLRNVHRLRVRRRGRCKPEVVPRWVQLLLLSSPFETPYRSTARRLACAERENDSVSRPFRPLFPAPGDWLRGPPWARGAS